MNEPESSMNTADWEGIPKKRCKASGGDSQKKQAPHVGRGDCEGDAEQPDHVDVTLYNKHGRWD